jgi:hypothetical protein
MTLSLWIFSKVSPVFWFPSPEFSPQKGIFLVFSFVEFGTLWACIDESLVACGYLFQCYLPCPTLGHLLEGRYCVLDIGDLGT